VHHSRSWTLAIPADPISSSSGFDATKSVVFQTQYTDKPPLTLVAAYSGEQSFFDWITEAIDRA